MDKERPLQTAGIVEKKKLLQYCIIAQFCLRVDDESGDVEELTIYVVISPFACICQK